MEKTGVVAILKSWNPETERYDVVKTYDLSQKTKVEFAGLEITTEGTNLSRDAADPTAAILLTLTPGVKPKSLYVYEQRSYEKAPYLKVAGEDILKVSPTWYASELKTLMYLQVYEGDPQKGHPKLLELTPITKIGEGNPGQLL